MPVRSCIFSRSRECFRGLGHAVGSRTRYTRARYNALSHPPDSFRTTPQDGWRRTLSLDDDAAAVRSHPRTEGARRHFVAWRSVSQLAPRSERPTYRSYALHTRSTSLRGCRREGRAWCVRKQCVGTKTTLSQAWSGNCIRGPQCAFEMSMFMCPAVHKLTRN